MRSGIKDPARAIFGIAAVMCVMLYFTKCEKELAEVPAHIILMAIVGYATFARLLYKLVRFVVGRLHSKIAADRSDSQGRSDDHC